jgi:ComEC/Rec2-related protein
MSLWARPLFRAIPFIAPVVLIWCVGQLFGVVVPPAASNSPWPFAVSVVAMTVFARSWVLVGLLSVFIAGFASTLSLRVQPSESFPPRRIVVFGEVDRDPRSSRVGERRMVITVRGVREGGTHLISHRILCHTHDLPWRNGATLRAGDMAWFHGELRPRSVAGTGEAIWGYRGYLARRGIHDQCRLLHVSRSVGNREKVVDTIRTSLKERVLSSLGPTERAGLVLSLLFGFRDTLSDDLERRLQSVSLSHLLVVSGYQVTMMFVMFRLVAIMVFAALWRRVGECFALGASWVYVAIVGWEPSAVRAGVAMTVYVLSDLLGNQRSMSRGIFLSLLVVTALWPGCFFEMGVQLTFAALMGIAVATAAFRRCSVVTQAVCTPFVVTMATMLVSLAWGGDTSALGLFLNPVVVPFVSLLGGPVSAAALAANYTPFDPGGTLLGTVAENLLSTLVGIAEFCELPPEGEDSQVIWRVSAGVIMVTAGALISRRWHRRAACLRGAG